MRRKLAPLLPLLLFALCPRAGAQPAAQAGPQPAQTPQTAAPPRPAQPATAAQPPADDPADVDTLDHIVAALYDVISGPATKQRDWNRMRSLFVTGARMIPNVPLRPAATAQADGPPKGDEAFAPRVLSVEDYVARAAPLMAKEGFYERESARRAEQYAHIAHVFSTYESRHEAADAKPFQRGINSIQLVNDGRRWWIVTILWEGELPLTPLPEKYLRSAP
jgi:hypothetical protein